MRERESAQLSFADTVTAALGGRRTQATLDQLDASIDWKALAEPIRKLYCNDAGGAPAEPVVMMLKIILLQKWFNLSDPQAEEQLNDRMSFRRFVQLRGNEPAPDETTLVKFRARLRAGGVERQLFDIVARSIEQRGLLVKEGTLVDALIIEAPTGRKTGKTDDDGNDQTTRDPDASFTKKHGRSYHGYKGHIAADRSGIVTGFAFSTAKHHDSRYIDELIKQEDKAVLADAAYADAARRRRLEKRGVVCGIAFKRARGQKKLHPLLRKINRAIASIRSGVEHTIARLRKWGMPQARYRGQQRNGCDFTMTLVAHNLRRAAWLVSSPGLTS